MVRDMIVDTPETKFLPNPPVYLQISIKCLVQTPIGINASQAIARNAIVAGKVSANEYFAIGLQRYSTDGPVSPQPGIKISVEQFILRLALAIDEKQSKNQRQPGKAWPIARIKRFHSRAWYRHSHRNK